MDLASQSRHAVARLGGRVATGLRDLTSDPTALESSGWWAVVHTFEGELTCARFDDVRTVPVAGPPRATRPWRGPAVGAWTSSMDEDAYVGAVVAVRERIAAGDVYQANVCRVLTAELPDGAAADLVGLAELLTRGNPAPYAGLVRVPAAEPGREPVDLVTASPELFLQRRGRELTSRPIKGTGRVAADITDKDRAENVMIVDLVRNDLGAVSETGSVDVPVLCEVEEHPGLVHLVSTVRSRLRTDAGWPELLDAAFPPGSVTGAPKLRALEVIREVEPARRGPYCGAVGWVDADAGTGELAVAIRTFWREGAELLFGTGAGITWGSDPVREWEETELKAAHLLAVAAGTSTEAPSVERPSTEGSTS